MRPLVRSEQLRLRMPKEVKSAIEKKARLMQMSQTAYVELLVRQDNEDIIVNENEEDIED
jgi:hypothetical protein